ncbi:MAG: short-chain dehydrogenase [Legionellales bacterium]|nr:short-chain dehydrogenase [Legionellales bacterium]
MDYLERFNLKGKTAFVVGGLGLLGLEVSKAMACAGAKVIILDLNLHKKDAFLKEMSSLKCDVIFQAFDCADEKQIEFSFNEILSRYQAVDIFVNCSYPRTPNWSQASFSGIDYKNLRENVDMHMNTYAWLAKQVADHMVKNHHKGSIIQFGSTYGIIGQDLTVYEGTDMKENMAYALIKGGITNLTRLMASYYGQWGIRVNTICPGGISGHVAGQGDQDAVFIENYSKKTPLKRLGRADEVASATLFLASDGASYISGTNLMVDGGWTII